MRDLKDEELQTLWHALCEAQDSLSYSHGTARRCADEIAAYRRLHGRIADEVMRRGLPLGGSVDWTAVCRKED